MYALFIMISDYFKLKNSIQLKKLIRHE